VKKLYWAGLLAAPLTACCCLAPLSYAQEKEQPGQLAKISHSLGVHLETYSQSVFAYDREFRFDPVGVNLDYLLTIDDRWFLGAGTGRFTDNIRQSQVHGEFTNTTLKLIAGFAQAPWWFWFYYSEEEDEAKVSTEGRVTAEIVDQFDYSAFAVETVREFEYADSLLDLGINVEYQQQDGATKSQLKSDRGVAAARNTSQGEGWLAGITIDLSYPYSLRENLFRPEENITLAPTLSISWSEPLTGETHGSSVAGIRTREGRFYRQKTEQTKENNKGSGQIGIGLSCSLAQLSIDAGALFPVDSGLNSKDMDDGKRLYIGINVVF
jgi:hypothetical protein